MARTSSFYDHFIIWLSSVTLIFNLPEQIFLLELLLLKENTCAKLLWNPCLHVEGMALTSSIYHHFIIWHSSVTLTFDLPEQMFQMALLLLRENTCATFLWNPCINVGVMARKSSIYVTFKCDIYLQPTWKRLQTALLLLKDNNCAKYF